MICRKSDFLFEILNPWFFQKWHFELKVHLGVLRIDYGLRAWRLLHTICFGYPYRIKFGIGHLSDKAKIASQK